MSSSYASVNSDAFNGSNHKAKIPDGSGGKSLSKYKVIDDTILIPKDGMSFIIFSANANVPVKTFTYDATVTTPSILDNKVHQIGTNGQYEDFTPNGVYASDLDNSTQFKYGEMKWKDPVSKPDIKHYTRASLQDNGLMNVDAGNDGITGTEGNVEQDANLEHPSNAPSSWAYTEGAVTMAGRVNKFVTTLSAGAGKEEDAPTRWRCVGSSLKIQCLKAAEYSAGYWKSVDYFPPVSTQTQSLFFDHDQCFWGQNTVAGHDSTWAGNATNSYLLRTTGGIAHGATTHIDLKLLDDYVKEEKFYAEKPSYNEGSLESLKSVQFNLQRKRTDTAWLESGLIHADNRNRVITDRSIASKFFTTTAAADDAFNFTLVDPVTQTLDHITYERSADLRSGVKNPSRMYGSATYEPSFKDISQFTSAQLDAMGVHRAAGLQEAESPWCMSLAGIEANAAMKQVLESQHDPNLSVKVIVLRNTGDNDAQFRIATSGVFEITPDHDSPDFQNSRPVLKEDAFALKQALKLGTSASRRFSR